LVLVVHRSNRAAVLATALGDVVAAEPLPPLVPEVVVVQGRALAGWLSMRLAERFGVWSAGEFPFPRRLVARVLDAIAGKATPSVLDEPGRLQWSLLALLERRLDEPGFAALRRYCKEDASGRGRFGLAATVARLFDRYLVHRPDLLAQWEAGEEPDDWQATLWRDAVALHGTVHTASRIRGATGALAAGPPPGIPPRLSIFGMTSLAPSYLQLVAALAEVIEVHLFVPSPSPKWWADLGRRAATSSEPQDEGHPLLSAFGALGRDFARLLESTCTYIEPPVDLFRPPAGDTMLATLQSDVLALRPRGARLDAAADDAAPSLPIAPDDRSIVVFSCHSPLREVEVLHDRLLGLLADDPTLEPRDIVVHLTDVDAYAPLVEAVFERERDDPTNLPFSIADRSPRAGNPTLDAWLRVLALVGSRMRASDVLDLLGVEAVALRFGFAPDELDTIRGWVQRAGIRWGIDARHRATFGQPAHEETTWRFGLRRLLLGVALPGRGRETFADTLPYDEIEGHAAELLGRLVHACETLFELSQTLAAERTVADWHAALESTIAATLAPRPSAQWELDDLRRAIVEVARAAATADAAVVVPLAVMRDAVVAAIDEAATMRGIAGHGIAFGALQPMRAIDARVVVVLGASDGKFPRPDRRVEFDRMRRKPRLGDRTTRDDDRHAFLEAILSAEQHLVIGYVGQSSQDDADLPPSVALAELLDVLGTSFHVPGTEDASPLERTRAVRERIAIREPMQPFSPRYFSDDPRLFSFSSAYCDGAIAVASPSQGERAPLFTEPLPPLPDAEIDLEQFVRFFRLPHSTLLKRRLGLDLADWSRDVGDREPMELDSLDHWRLGDRLVDLLLEGIDEQRCYELLRLSGELPLAAMGKAAFMALSRAATPVIAAVRGEAMGDRLPPLDVSLAVGGLRLRGQIRRRYTRGLREVAFARLNARHLLGLWIRHLVTTLVARDSDGVHQAPEQSILVARAGAEEIVTTTAFLPVADPRAVLEPLAEIFRRGMCEPLPLFPKAGLAFARSHAQRDRDPLGEARRQLDVVGGDGRDPAVRRIYGDVDLLAGGYAPTRPSSSTDAFESLSLAVFQPLLAHEDRR
jgi:exodeoxyribonuclease V gamma subunit